MKKILFITNEIDSFKIKTDTTYSLILASNECNLKVYYANASMILQTDHDIFINCNQLNLLSKSYEKPDITKPWFHKLESSFLNLKDFYAVFIRVDPPFNMEYYYLTQIMTLAEQKGIKVYNNSYALRNFNEKLSILNFPELITPTIVTKNKLFINNFIIKHHECVIKPLDQMAGRSVFKISKNDPNKNAIIETLTNFETETIMVQKFIPEVINGDKRIFIVNGQIIDYCLYRIPNNNEIRSNIAAGGSGIVKRTPESDIKNLEPVSKWLKQQNILIAGLDVIGNYLNEINITSPTGARQILEDSGINIPKLVIESIFVEKY
jgi:glutathione synthase